DRGRDGPGPVPVDVEPAQRPGRRRRLAGELDSTTFALVYDLRVVLDRRRRGREHEPVLTVVIGIEENAEVVALGDVAVADLGAGNDGAGFIVVEPGAHVHRFTVGDDANFGALGDRLAFVQLALDESGDRSGFAPDRIGQASVDLRRFRDDARGRGRILGRDDQKDDGEHSPRRYPQKTDPSHPLRECSGPWDCPSWDRTRTLLIQSQACCQLHQGAENGAEGARTPDLLGAIQALSQLSYSPERRARK